MNEASAMYLAEFVKERVYERFGSAIAPLQLLMLPASHGESECRLLIPILGARTSSKVLEMIAPSMGTQREVEFPHGRENIWMCRRYTSPDFPRPSGWKEQPWLITIWSRPETHLGDYPHYELDQIATDVEMEAESDEQWRESLMLDDEESSYESEPTELDPDLESLHSLATKVAAVGQKLRDWHELRITARVVLPTEQTAKSYVVILHGFQTIFRAQDAIRKVVAGIPAVNTFGLINLKDAKIEGPGWLGRYALVLAETVFVRSH